MDSPRRVNILWPADLLERAQAAAKAEGLSLSSWLRRVVTLALR